MANLETPYATRLCLSGVESRRLLDTFKDFGVKHIQVSFYYLRRVFNDPLDFEEYAKHFHTVIIDSGTVYGNIKNEDQKKELLDDYASFLGALSKQHFTAAVYESGINLDKILPDEALIYVLDDVRHVFDNDLAAVFRNLKYVGVSNKECSAKGGENLQPIFTQAQKTGAYVHAFGTSSKRILSKFPFYSANSSSWRTGSRYLNTYIYEGPGRGLRLYQPTDKSDPVKTDKETRTIRRRQGNITKVRQPDIHQQINWDEVYEGDSWEVDKGNLAQWLLYARDLENFSQNKYYLTDTQRTQITLRKRDLLSANEETKETEQETDPVSEVSQTSLSEGHEILDAEVVDEGDGIPSSIPISPEGEETISKELELANIANELASPISADRITPVDDRMRTLRKCDFCILQDRCPKYTPGGYCAFGLPPENPTYDHTKLEQHILEDGADLLAIQKDRILQLYLEEKMDASGANKDLTNNIKIYMEMVALLSEATDKRDTLEVKAKGTGVMDLFKSKKK